MKKWSFLELTCLSVALCVVERSRVAERIWHILKWFQEEHRPR